MLPHCIHRDKTALSQESSKETGMTATTSIYTIISAIVAAEKAFLGANRVWKPKNPQQAEFVRDYLEWCRADLDRIPEFESIAALSEVPINEFLKKKGFNIQLEKFPIVVPPERAWGAASVLDLLLKWKEPGTVRKMKGADGKLYPAAHLDEGYSVFAVEYHENPVGLVQTAHGDNAYFTVVDKPLDGFALIKKAQAVISANREMEYFSGITFPMVDLDHTVDIGWLKEMGTWDEDGYFNKIIQALQQTKLKMNHLGAHVKDAVAIGGIRATSMPPPTLVIDRPFLFCIERPGLMEPLFSAYITEEHWKDPGSLNM
jgi:hypothetical protein